VQVAGDLAERLRHKTSLQADVSVAHVAFDLSPWGESRHGVDDHDIDRTGADEDVGNLKSLFARIGLRDEQLVDVDPDGSGVDGIHGVLGVDVGTRAAVALRLGHHVHGER